MRAAARFERTDARGLTGEEVEKLAPRQLATRTPPLVLNQRLHFDTKMPSGGGLHPARFQHERSLVPLSLNVLSWAEPAILSNNYT